MTGKRYSSLRPRLRTTKTSHSVISPARLHTLARLAESASRMKAGPPKRNGTDTTKLSEVPLLKPAPVGAAYYPGSSYDPARCQWLIAEARQTRFHRDDPLTVLTSWPTGKSCVVSTSPTGNCTHGAFPVYVVNATMVKHIQVAVNFARNRYLRLIIK